MLCIRSADREDVFMFSNTISFDAHILQVMPPLTLGAKLVIAKPKGHMDPEYMAGLIANHGITTMVFTVPTLVSRNMANMACIYEVAATMAVFGAFLFVSSPRPLVLVCVRASRFAVSRLGFDVVPDIAYRSV
jgi:hypothetical protein